MFQAEFAFLKLLESCRTDFLNRFFEWITMLGEETLAIILMVVLYFAVNKKLAQKIFFATLTSLAGNSSIKNLLKMPRPFFSGKVSCVRPETATGYSFPSGHTQSFATWSSALSIALKNRWLLILSILLTALVGFSRLFLGVHFPTDVIAGALLGFLCSYLCDRLHRHFPNKILLYTIPALLFFPFACYFMVCPDPLYEDFFKCYGMVLAFAPATYWEETYVSFEVPESFWKKFLRVIIALTVALIVKKGTSLIVFSGLRLIFVSSAISYGFLVFVELAFCPYLFKKLNI